MPRSTGRTSMRQTPPALIRTQGAGSNYPNRPLHECEPAGHGIGRSRGGLTTKIHTAVDGNGRPLAVVVTGGQRNDQATLTGVLDEITVPRHRGRARSRPDAVIADRAYSSRTARQLLRSRGVTAIIPQKSDEIAARLRRGHRGGRPPAFDEIRCSAISSNDPSACSNNGADWPPATTNSPSSTAPPSYSAPASPGPAISETRPSQWPPRQPLVNSE